MMNILQQNIQKAYYFLRESDKKNFECSPKITNN